MEELEDEINKMTESGFPMRGHSIDGVAHLNVTSLYNFTIYAKRKYGVEEAYNRLQNALERLSLESGGRTEEND